MSLSNRSIITICSVVVAAVTVATVAGCGSSEVRDRPEDCTSHEYLDPSSNRCTPCPPIQQPDCREGCGYRVRSDDRGCPVARCVSTCDLCGPGAYFSDNQTSCVDCENRPACDSLDCEGELTIEGSYRGVCPPVDQYTCGDCQHPEQGCRANSEGRCVDLTVDAGM